MRAQHATTADEIDYIVNARYFDGTRKAAARKAKVKKASSRKDRRSFRVDLVNA